MCIFKNDIRDRMTDIISVCREISYPSLVRIRNIYTYLYNFKFNLQPKNETTDDFGIHATKIPLGFSVVKPTL